MSKKSSHVPKPTTGALQLLLHKALAHHEAGRLTEAEPLYHEILKTNPRHSDALHLCGVLAHKQGQKDEAVRLIRQAITITNNVPHYHNNLGNIFLEQGQWDDAIQAYRKALVLQPHFPEAHNNLARAYQGKGTFELAVTHYQRAIALNPHFLEALNNFGMLYKTMSRLDDAKTQYERALAVQPAFAEAHNNLGMVLALQKKPDEATKHYQQALAINPHLVPAYMNLADTYVEIGETELAITHYENALALAPDYAEAHNNLGNVLREKDRLDEAGIHYERARILKPDLAQAHSNMGNIHNEQGRFDEAVLCFQEALRLDPAFADAHNNLGYALQYQGQLDEALVCYRRAIAIKPDYIGAYNNLCNTLHLQGKLDEAFVHYERALALDPNLADTHNNLGNAYLAIGKFDEALAGYHRAVTLKPNHAKAHWNESLLHLMKGDFVKGWGGYEWRWHTKDFKPHGYNAPQWEGQSFSGETLVVHCEQGFGDSIQFIRYLPMVKEKGGTVFLVCQPGLESLFQNGNGIDHLFTKRTDVPPYDYQISMLGLPRVFGTTLNTIPATVPYLKSDTNKTAPWRERLADLSGLKIGIAWRGNAMHLNDRNRSMLPAQFVQFLNQPNLSLVNLQKDARPDELESFSNLFNAAPFLTDFSDTAALISTLDLVISVDTSVCHLAGALGIPTWVFIPFVPDWRWMLDRSDSPWYPSMRLFRQSALNDWSRAIDNVHKALHTLLDAPVIDLTVVFPEALRLHQSGQFAEAEKLYQQILTVDPLHADSLHLCGVIAYQTKDFEKSVTLISKALTINENAPTYLSNLGNALKECARYDEAEKCFRRAIALQPNYAEAHTNLGLTFVAQNNYDAAAVCYQQALTLQPDLPDALNNMGIVLRHQKKFDEAVAHYEQALKIKPDYPAAHMNLGNVLNDLDRSDEAILHFERALATWPDFAEAHMNLAVTLNNKNKTDEAIAHFERALAINPNYADAYSNYGNIFRQQFQLDKAEAYYRKALALKPDLIEAYNNLGAALEKQGHLNEALELYQHALKLNPDYIEARCNIAFIHLLRGEFKTGWSDYEWRLRTPKPKAPRRDYDQPLWNGKDLGLRKLLLWAEQGIGDEIMFAGLVPELHKRGISCVIHCETRLLPLFMRSFPYAKVLAELTYPLDPDLNIAAHSPIASLAHYLRPDLASFKATSSFYLCADKNLTETIRAHTSNDKPRIGIAWRTNNKDTGVARSISLKQLAPLLNRTDVQWISLQYGDPEKLMDEIQKAGVDVFIDPAIDQMKDMDSFAAQIAGLDLVITIDNSTAHVAGALGTPTWLMLPLVPDWRWLLDRDDSVWYASIRLFRQKTLNDWDSVIHDVLTELSIKYTKHPNIAALFDQAVQLHQNDDLSEADTIYRKILEIDPHHADSLHLRGVIAYQREQSEEALALIQQALVLREDAPFYHNSLANVIKNQGNPADAMTHYKRALALQPDYPEAASNLGYLLGMSDQTNEGLTILHQVLDKHPAYAKAYNDLGTVLDHSGDYTGAIEAFRQALLLEPNFAEALWNQALVQLRLGDFATGWKHYEWRFQHPRLEIKMRAYTAPLWKGENLGAGRLLIWGDQGIGDQIMFAGMVPELQQRGIHCVLDVTPRLQPLLARSFPSLEITSSVPNNWSDVPNIAAHIPLSSLGQWLRPDFESFKTAPSPFLKADEQLTQSNKNRTANGLPRVGIAWHSKNKKTGNERSITLERLAPLLHTKNIQWVSLQYGAPEDLMAEAANASVTLSFDSTIDQLEDMERFAAQIAGLDLVITIDNSTAHLAGALGVPTLLLLPYAADWRWFLDREDCVWYPSVRLFRQPKMGDWDAVIDTVAKEVEKKFAPLKPSHQTDDISILFNKAVQFHQNNQLPEADSLYQHILSIDPNHSDSLNLHGVVAHQTGHTYKAAALIRQALAIRDDAPFYHNNLATVLKDQNKIDEAIAHYERALTLQPDYHEAFDNLVLMLKNHGRLQEAALWYRRRIEIMPQSATLYNDLGLVLKDQNNVSEAEINYKRALELNPDFPAAYNNLGLLLQGRGDFDEALTCYNKALALQPDLAEAVMNKANVFKEQDKSEDAIDYYQRALTLKPTLAEAHYNWGTTLQEQGSSEEALAHFDQALTLKFDYPDAHNNRGNALRSLNRLEESIEAYEKAVTLKPTYAGAHCNQGTSYFNLGFYDKAWEKYRHAAKIDPTHPDPPWNKSILMLLEGDFSHGWMEYESRWKQENRNNDTPRRFYAQPLWQGEVLGNGRLLVWGEQGIGDEIMFAGLMPHLQRLGISCVLDCIDRLRPLFSRSFPNVDVVSGLQTPLNPSYNIVAHTPIASLAQWLRPDLESFKETVSPYLAADAALTAKIHGHISNKKRRIGIAWYAKSKEAGRVRSISLAQLKPLFMLPDIQWVSLQYGTIDVLENEAKEAGIDLFIDPAINQMQDMDSFAAQIAGLDLVISIDNSTAHLAAALGIPTWVLLPYVPNWRWLLGRSDSPWYPSVRLFRQHIYNDWAPVIQDVAVQLVAKPCN